MDHGTEVAIGLRTKDEWIDSEHDSRAYRHDERGGTTLESCRYDRNTSLDEGETRGRTEVRGPETRLSFVETRNTASTRGQIAAIDTDRHSKIKFYCNLGCFSTIESRFAGDNISQRPANINKLTKKFRKKITRLSTY